MCKQGSVTIITSQQSADTLRIARFLERNGYPLEILDFREEDNQQLLHKFEVNNEDLPVVLIHNKGELLN